MTDYDMNNEIAGEGIDRIIIRGAGQEDSLDSVWNEVTWQWDVVLQVEASESPEPYHAALNEAGFELVSDCPDRVRRATGR